MSEHRYPPIEKELADTVWPAMVEQAAAQAEMSDREFQELVSSATAMWQPDVSRGGAISTTETTIASADGHHELPVLAMVPARSQRSVPCIYYTANGGKMGQTTRMALTDVETRWVVDLGVAFVSVAPRVGPEFPHPAQVEDAYAGLIWLEKNAGQLGIDPSRIIIMGKSGGGGIAAATALYARDHAGPTLAHQMLICPMIDDRETAASSRYDVPPWTRSNNRVGWQAILGDTAGGPDVSPYAAPARATDLNGLPPAYLEVGSSEVFRDETIDYAARLAQSGVPIELHSWAGGFHSFEIFAPDASLSRACVAARTSYLERALRA